MKANKRSEELEKCQMQLSVPRQYNVMQYVRFWSGNAIPESKGGSFNVALYMRILSIKSKA
jgi:hypothetical protein